MDKEKAKGFTILICKGEASRPFADCILLTLLSALALVVVHRRGAIVARCAMVRGGQMLG